jgi:hypothetical protein
MAFLRSKSDGACRHKMRAHYSDHIPLAAGTVVYGIACCYFNRFSRLIFHSTCSRRKAVDIEQVINLKLVKVCQAPCSLVIPGDDFGIGCALTFAS